MINPEYFSMMEQLQNHFATNGQISLQTVLQPDALQRLQELSKQRKRIDTLMHTRHEEAPLMDEVTDYLHSNSFFSFLSELTQGQLAVATSTVQAYGHRDFLLRHTCQPGIACLLEIGNSLDQNAGGSSCYTQGEDTVTIPPVANSLTLLHVDEQTEEFVTYVNHHTKGQRVFLKFLFTFSKA